ncbi:helix-turn-helix domain-containing protein [Tsukamurella serpentis]
MTQVRPADQVGIQYAMRRLGKSRATVKRMAVDGRLPATKLPGPLGAYLFDPADVDAYAERANA